MIHNIRDSETFTRVLTPKKTLGVSAFNQADVKCWTICNPLRLFVEHLELSSTRPPDPGIEAPHTPPLKNFIEP